MNKLFTTKEKSGSLLIYIGILLVIAFLIAIWIGPQVSNRLGKVSFKKQGQESRAAVINDPSIDDFYSTKTYVNTWGQEFTLIWKTSYVGYCNASGGWDGKKPSSGSQSFLASLSMKTSFTLTCWGNYSQSVTQTILVNNPNVTQGGLAPGPCNPYGDVNANGYITNDDAGRVLQIVAKIGNPPTPSETKRADVDGDGQVTSVDALKILRVIAGLDSSFPVCAKPFF